MKGQSLITHMMNMILRTRLESRLIKSADQVNVLWIN
jgi:hypothetical protein